MQHFKNIIFQHPREIKYKVPKFIANFIKNTLKGLGIYICGRALTYHAGGPG
jgi:hypothetical protein